MLNTLQNDSPGLKIASDLSPANSKSSRLQLCVFFINIRSLETWSAMLASLDEVQFACRWTNRAFRTFVRDMTV